MDILGVDVSKSKLDVAFLRDNEYVLATFDNDSVGFVKLQKWLKMHKANKLHVCLEATGRYGDGLALYLHEAGYWSVSRIRPAFKPMLSVSSSATRRTGKMPSSSLTSVRHRIQNHGRPHRRHSRSCRQWFVTWSHYKQCASRKAIDCRRGFPR